jgi:hypothetical protein
VCRAIAVVVRCADSFNVTPLTRAPVLSDPRQVGQRVRGGNVESTTAGVLSAGAVACRENEVRAKQASATMPDGDDAAAASRIVCPCSSSVHRRASLDKPTHVATWRPRNFNLPDMRAGLPLCPSLCAFAANETRLANQGVVPWSHSRYVHGEVQRARGRGNFRPASRALPTAQVGKEWIIHRRFCVAGTSSICLATLQPSKASAEHFKGRPKHSELVP